MADSVIDIVARLTYDVQDAAMKQALGTINSQIQAVGNLTNRVDKLKKALNDTSALDIERRNRIIKLINQQERAIDEVTTSIGEQVAANNKLQEVITKQVGIVNSLNTQYANLVKLRDSATDPAKLAQYNTQLGILQSRMQAAYSSGIKGAGQFNSLSFSTINILRDLPYGIQGIGNNLGPFFDNLTMKMKQLKAEGQPSTAIFKELGGALFGLSGILSLVVMGLTLFGDELFRTGKAAKEAKSEYDKFLESINNNSLQAAKNTTEQTNKVKLLVGVLQAGNATLDQQTAAYRELQGLYPSQLKNMTKEQFLQSGIVAQINAQIAARERATALQKDAVEAQGLEAGILKQIETQTAKVEKAQKLLNAARANVTGSESSQNLVEQRKKQLNSAQFELSSLQQQLTGNRSRVNALQQEALQQTLQAGLLGLNGDKTEEDPYRKAIEGAETQRENAERLSDLLKILRESEIGLNEEFKLLYESDQLTRKVVSQEERELRDESYNKRQKNINLKEELAINELDQSLLRQKIAIAEAFQKARDVAKFRNDLQDLKLKKSKIELQIEQGQEVAPYLDTRGKGFERKDPETIPTIDGEVDAARRNREHAEERRKAKIKELAKFSYDTAVQTLNEIYAAQLHFLDKEIQARKTRVSEATELAKRGNTEALEAEKARLDEAQKKRDEVAQRQLQVNALLRASEMAIVVVQALKTVTNAGSNGDPYTIALRIAAAVAALSAGFAAVSTLATAFSDKGFAEGGYTGKGDKYQPAGTVHKGEFVFDAEKTGMYRTQFEAIHKGANPFTVFSPRNQSISHSYASKTELSGVEKKLDKVVEALHDNKFKQDVFFDENGVGLLTQKAARRSNSRFK